YQSGTFDAKNRHVSKRGSPHLRKVLFEIASMILGYSSNCIILF
ncbi:transposase, partial [Pseudoflavonifractor phocaeensis]|nr:transposase [Pseudoflavonifractor phocaeensis]